eukprot:gene9906-2091_t
MDLSRTSQEFLSSIAYHPPFTHNTDYRLINAIWFAREVKQNPQIRKYVVSSAVGAFIYFTAWITWIAIFQEKRSEWGEAGDRLSMIIPKGRP